MQQYIKKNYFCFLLVFQKIFIFLLFVIQVYLARVWTILINTTARLYHCFLVLQLFEAEQHAFNTLFSNLHFKSSLLADKILDYASFRDILFTQKDYQLCQLRM